MSTIVSQITDVSIVCSAICSGANDRKHQSFASLAFVRWIPKGPVTRKMFPFGDVTMWYFTESEESAPAPSSRRRLPISDRRDSSCVCSSTTCLRRRNVSSLCSYFISCTRCTSYRSIRKILKTHFLSRFKWCFTRISQWDDIFHMQHYFALISALLSLI